MTTRPRRVSRSGATAAASTLGPGCLRQRAPYGSNGSPGTSLLGGGRLAALSTHCLTVALTLARTSVRSNVCTIFYTTAPTKSRHFEQMSETGVRLGLVCAQGPTVLLGVRPISRPPHEASAASMEGHPSPGRPSHGCISRRRRQLVSDDRVHEIPDGPVDSTGLTPRQRKVLEVIRDAVERKGYPPSMREIGEAVGLTSPSSVAHQLATLERKGYVRRDPNRPRAIEVMVPADPVGLRHRHDRVRRRPAYAVVRPGDRPDRRRRPDPGRAGRRGGLPAAAPAGRRGHAVPAPGRRRLDGRRRDLRRRLGRGQAAAGRRERRHRGRHDRRRGHRQDVQAAGRPRLADAAQPDLRTRSPATTPPSSAGSTAVLRRL